MATRVQIERMLEKIEHVRPDGFFKRVNEVQVGIGAVLRLLNESGDQMTAGAISDALEISTARVAVLLKKMAAKGLVTKESSVLDARVTIVRLTELGKKTIVEIEEDICQQMGRIIDAIGEARLDEFIAISGEIKDVLKPPKLPLREE